MGKKALEAGQIFVDETGLNGILTPEDFIRQREEMLRSMFPQSELLPGEPSPLPFQLPSIVFLGGIFITYDRMLYPLSSL